ncbi:MAG: phage integrase SAM-like domain-containing protein, partial [Litorilituus sp.]|nr:phage integrase SAM-like domain-containing protein [Litorilituus sp.]
MNTLTKTIDRALDENAIIAKTKMAASTLKAYQRKSKQIKKMRLEGNYKLGNKQLSEINSTDIEMLLARLCVKYKAKTLNEYLTILRAIFVRAYTDGIIKTNPMAKIKNYKVV